MQEGTAVSRPQGYENRKQTVHQGKVVPPIPIEQPEERTKVSGDRKGPGFSQEDVIPNKEEPFSGQDPNTVLDLLARFVTESNIQAMIAAHASITLS